MTHFTGLTGTVRRAGTTVCLCLLLTIVTGCATAPYQYGVQFDAPHAVELPDEAEFVRGPSNWYFDRADWFWPGSWLSKLILWDLRVDSHTIGDDTERALRDYLAANDMRHVKVYLNAYHPGVEWRRLVHNRSVGPGWRYTIGVLSWVQYAAMPGIIFGGDHYNPYTNSIHLYSDIPAIAIHEGGHAKDFANKQLKGTYAFIYMLPLVNLYHEAVATADTQSYFKAEQEAAYLREGYHVLYPAYGTYLGGGAGDLSTVLSWQLYIAGVLGGHAVGRVRGAFVQVPDNGANY